LSFFFLTLMAITLLDAGARASAFSLGRIQTVSSDGSLDVIRNPAILASHRENNGVGFIVLAAPFHEHRYGYDAYRSSWLTSFRARDRRYTAGGIRLSYIKKISGGAIGFALDTDNAQGAEYYRYAKTYTSLNAADQNIFTMKGSNLTVSPRLVISLGKMVAGNHAVGAQLSLGYTQAGDRYLFSSLLNSTVDQRHHADKKTDGMNAEASLGYSYRDALSQAGIMVRSGRFLLKRTKIHYTHAEFTSSLFFAGSVSEPQHLKYDRGLSIVAGGYRKLTSFVAVALRIPGDVVLFLMLKINRRS